ncbi:MAG: flagellar hook-associated protein FlgL [Planctomycetota bacterium]|nr:flagellar hook-associated protein FlgL [Planctomycetota bacterium]MDG2142329.1 flagellar hook-associated protein FlgL [Planctomycetota bacterium]
MSLRISSGYSYQQFLGGIRSNQFDLTKSQAQISTGLRLLRPSDDPGATARVISLRARIAHNDTYSASVSSGRTLVDYGASVLQDSSELLTEIRTLVIQSMNGTLSEDDRKSLGAEISFLRDQMVELANSKIQGQYVFGGTATGSPPYSETTIGGSKYVTYDGNGDQQKMPVGEGVDIAVNVPGSAIFSKNEATGTGFSGLTGVSSGTTANMGQGFEYIEVMHTGTSAPGIAAVGVSLVGGGSSDTIIGDETLEINSTTGEVTFGGEPVSIPDVTSPEAADVVVKTASGAEIHLDMSGWTGADSTSVVSGAGSISIDGTNFTPIDFTETNLELKNSASGSVVHVNLTEVNRAGEELVQFEGAVNMFDALQEIVEALENESGLPAGDVVDRLGMGLNELDRNQSNLLGGIGVLGSRSVRMSNSLERLEGQTLELEGMRSQLRDVDFSEAVLDLTQAEQRLELVQMSGTRMISNSLLNFMR